MSRCFPYPLTGYLKQGSVESIKLEREKFLGKTEQKLHNKRDEKRERKEKEKIEGVGKKFKKLDDGLNGFKDEHWENSDLTEEHEQAVCYLSDGTQNSSSKRKSEALSSSSSECKVTRQISNGKIKLRFSFKKPGKLDEVPICSTSGRVELIAQEQSYPSSKNANSTIPAPEKKPCHDGDNGMKMEELLYKPLIEDWVPLSLELQNDDDWLFIKKHQGTSVSKRCKIEHDEIRCCSTALCPRANFLEGANIHALPYTVPF